MKISQQSYQVQDNHRVRIKALVLVALFSLLIIAIARVVYQGTFATMRLHEVVLRGDIIELERMLDAGYDINQLNQERLLGFRLRSYPAQYDENVTPLYVAIGCHNPNIVSLLLSRGADITLGGEHGTPLAHAIYSLSGGIPCHRSENTSQEIFDPAPPIEVVRLLIAHGADLDKPANANGESPSELCERLEEMEVLNKMNEWADERSK